MFDLTAHGITEGFRDGIAADRNGNLWVACFGTGKVTQETKTVKGFQILRIFVVFKYVQIAEVKPSLSGGSCTLLGTITFLGSKSVTACCFGGDSLGDLFVTTAKMWDDEAASPNAGSLFVIRGVRSHGDGWPVIGMPGREAVVADVAAKN